MLDEITSYAMGFGKNERISDWLKWASERTNESVIGYITFYNPTRSIDVEATTFTYWSDCEDCFEKSIMLGMYYGPVQEMDEANRHDAWVPTSVSYNVQ